MRIQHQIGTNPAVLDPVLVSSERRRALPHGAVGAECAEILLGAALSFLWSVKAWGEAPKNVTARPPIV
ncbi:hypothetical protein [Sorangium sp. So ce341]|uniref:hypothetical protein n=1 Tax=Sorangium sp. So ce341 TaxID=3133302 RepID=UPI003F60DF4E